MRIIKVTLQVPSFYHLHDKGEGVREAKKLEYKEAFYARFAEIGVTINEYPSDTWGSTVVVVCEDRHIADIMANNSMSVLPDCDEKYQVTEVEVLYSTKGAEDNLRPMLDKIEAAASRISDMASTPDHPSAWNELCNQPIPGPHLLHINDLMLKQDCCTDELQGCLDDGWRILAVSPQEQRRPDYILGRVNLAYNSRGRALR